MKPALLLIDLQNDYLTAAGLQPSAGEVVEQCRALLLAFRAAGMPVIHIVTTVTREPDNRMPHWKAADKWSCEESGAGHRCPAETQPAASEAVIHKQFFSGFDNPLLEKQLREAGCGRVVLAGIHLHGCVRATAIDAYSQGFSVCIATDAVTSDDPVHAAITRRYLAARSMAFEPVSRIVASLPRAGVGGAKTRLPDTYEHVAPADRRRVLWHVPIALAGVVASGAENLGAKWRKAGAIAPAVCAANLRRLAAVLADNLEALAGEIVRDVGKPITMARAEVKRSAALLHAVADRATDALEERTSAAACYRRVPLGIVGLLTPWNNPLAIPVGKLAPALLYGNAVLWKPALPGSRIAESLLALWRTCDAEVPIELVTGDAGTAVAVASDPRVDAVTLSGSELAGHAIAEIAARRSIPFQAELGGNNAAIVATGADLAVAARHIAAGAFGFAGQRCTANRRAIVLRECAGPFRDALVHATRGLVLGDPADERTDIGPVISEEKRRQLLALFSRAENAGALLMRPHDIETHRAAFGALLESGSYCLPLIAFPRDSAGEIVHHETFGPLLVVQEADSFDHALALCNGVRQGLVAALFGGNAAEKTLFLAQARAGVLKLDQSTVEADAVSPFGGWKSSGIGPPEHGVADRDFFSRMQTIYEPRH